MSAAAVLSLYCAVCLCIFAYCARTAFDTAETMHRRGEPDYPDPPSVFLLGLFLSSFVPFINIVMVLITIKYRKL